MKDFFDDLPLSPDSEMHHDTYLSMGEYEELRLMLASAKAAFAQGDEDITPDPQIKANIRAMVAARKKGFEMPSIHINWGKILNHPLPAYQFGLAMVLVLFFAVLVGRNLALNNAQNTVVVYKTDTVFQNARKATPPATLLSDSDTKIVSPAYSGSYFADSIDYNIDDNTNTGTTGTSPTGIKSDPSIKINSPAYQKINHPADINTPVKGGGVIDDSSKWYRNMHGLL